MFYYQGFICQLALYISFCRGMMRFVQSYARAHAHAYPHTPTRIRMRTHTCSSFKQTEHSRGGIVPADFVQ